MTPTGMRILLSLLALTIAAVIALVPGGRVWISRLMDRARTPSLRQARGTALTIFVVSIIYMLLTAWGQGRELIPKFHDEHMHLLQMRMLAAGKLWTSPHLLADFFETFHVFVKPVYASIYFPGTALAYVPTVWLGLPYWAGAVIVAGACCAFLYRVVTELLDGVSGILAALMLLSLQWFRYLSLMVMSHSVMLLLGLLILWAWLNWRREKRLGWAAVIGLLAGWAAITRPVDALCYCIPVGIAMLIEMRGMPARRVAQTILLIVACAVPLLSIQLIENHGVTGQWLKTPYRKYADEFTPQMSFGFHQFDATVRPQTTLRQRQDYYDQFTVPAAKAHRPDAIVGTWLKTRFPLLAEVDFPNRLLIVLLPFALLGLTDIRRRVVGSILVIYIGFYSLFAYLLPVYCVVIAPAIIALVLMGKWAVEHRLRLNRAIVEVFLTVAIALLCIVALPEIDRENLDDGFLTPTMHFSYVEMPKHVQTPAIVLFRYQPGDNTNEEPVYNLDAVDPDDAPIIRAHDLGEARDGELFAYYAKMQPTRTVYLYDRASRKFFNLGNVVDLAKRFPAPSH